ncbi:MAG: GNAT family N-acetyltransferase [Pseudonocardiaceae bacterium]|nr:GNAT family N-acetyltransferase [Pseudonocardiaceae bacterium]
MSGAEELLTAQTQRLRGIDPLLPPAAPPPPGEVLTTGPVAGILVRSEYPLGSPARMWSASHVCELVPLLGGAGFAGMNDLLAAWHVRLPGLGLPTADSACVVSWPSRDVECSRALLDHGFVPLSMIAVHTPIEPGVPSHPDGVRAADPADLEDCVTLALAEQEYSAMVGSSVLRGDTEQIKRGLLAGRLQRGEPIWVAERDGVVVGLAECGYSDAAPGSWTASRLPAGRWGYVNCASVLPGARSRGVGGQLVARVHASFAAAGAAGSYLYYNPPNPLSSVFWPKQGYRPLWTVWEARPATTLR